MSIARKICMVGDFGVGKTSLIEQFVHKQFSDRYLTTIGVKIDTKDMSIHGQNLRLVIWDLAGKSSFSKLDHSFLKGAAGYLLVADGTRSETIATAQSLAEEIAGQWGDLPFCFLINKSDLEDQWEANDSKTTSFAQCVFKTSAKTGEGVDDAFDALAERVAP